MDPTRSGSGFGSATLPDSKVSYNTGIHKDLLIVRIFSLRWSHLSDLLNWESHPSFKSYWKPVILYMYACVRYQVTLINKETRRLNGSNSPALPQPMVTSQQWWASYFHKVTELLYFRYWWKKLATFNPLPIFPCNGSVTVTRYWFFKCNESFTSYDKM